MNDFRRRTFLMGSGLAAAEPLLSAGMASATTDPDAEEAGLQSIATVTGVAQGGPVTIHLGILESIRIGDIELRNIPMQWIDMQRPALSDGSQPAGVLGTTTFHHLLTTMDYAGQALELRRRTTGFRTAGDRLPLWLAGDHFPCPLSSMNDYDPRVVTLDTGGLAHGLDTTVELAEQVGPGRNTITRKARPVRSPPSEPPFLLARPGAASCGGRSCPLWSRTWASRCWS